MDAESEPGYRIGALLTIPGVVLKQRVRGAAEREGFGDLSLAHLSALSALTKEGMRLTDLAARAGMAKQSMGYLVQELERGGYFERVPDPDDGRAKIIRRTERAWAYHRLAARVVAELEDEWAALLGADGLADLKVLLTRLCDALGYHYQGSVSEASRGPASPGRPASASY